MGDTLVSSLSHAEIVGAFERSTANAADEGGAVATGERVADLPGAMGAVEESGRGLMRVGLGHGAEPIVGLSRGEGWCGQNSRSFVASLLEDDRRGLGSAGVDVGSPRCLSGRGQGLR